MPIDPQIESAIRTSVERSKQIDSLADKLIAWIKAINSGNEDINDPDAASRHLELIYEETTIDDKDDE
ncbi:CxC ATPase DNA modification system associated small protein [Desulfofustis glycolicus]|uniref:Uncharacterized protein n=1 Tax=Desulfofustis glycolicus DSM 9705 TaxID=1121409 RepID=A0A1M5UJQ5_9BACT|nr:CxC ATPase DNA modification system associated small protein [Desulfofustis glycolicus]SHH63312.1 hypothetical protein SAMN02745124_01210 [Desulfofustis glycolicus DSM 9705]